jgi:hypothetical protein
MKVAELTFPSPMTERQIHLFREPLIAVYRPTKKTYTILQYMEQGRYWKRYLPDAPHVLRTTLRNQAIPPAPTQINIYRNNTDSSKFIHCVTTGEYLAYDTYSVAVLKKKINSRPFPLSIYAAEFTCTTVSTPPNEIPPLWTLRQEPVLTIQPIIQVVQPVAVKPLPTRIAWILAEHAGKMGDTCSITLEQISPITASVTTCFHVFDTNALTTWFEYNDTCPMCKEKCVATPAFKESDTAETLSETSD